MGSGISHLNNSNSSNLLYNHSNNSNNSNNNNNNNSNNNNYNNNYNNSNNKIKKDLSQFKFLSLIGEGGLAVVKQAIYLPTNKVMAVKEIKFSNIRKHTKGFLLLETELAALKLAQHHPFIIKLNFAFYTKNTCYLVMDSLTGGDLRLYLSEGEIFSEYIVAYIIACIGSALYYLHKKNIIHRDIKPENIIFDRHGIPYLTDFGVAYVEYEEKIPICSESSGTLAYLAPEVLTPSHRHSYQSDMWSLGIVAYELLFAVRPYIVHCPKSFIYFSENYYHSLWDKIETLPIINDSFQVQNTLPITGSHSIHPSPPDTKFYHEFNWKSLPILEVITFPDHLKICENNFYHHDNHLPEYLQTPIPTKTPDDVLVSNSCIEFISSLLDPRIPNRLGTNLQNYSLEWECNNWFIEHQINFEILFAGINSYTPPFHPNIVKVMDATRSRFDNRQSISSKNSSSSGEINSNLNSGNAHSGQNNNNNNSGSGSGSGVGGGNNIIHNNNNLNNNNDNNNNINNNNNHNNNLNNNNHNNNINNNNNNNQYSYKLTEDEQTFLVNYDYVSPEYLPYYNTSSQSSSSWNFLFNWKKSCGNQNLNQQSTTNKIPNRITRTISEPPVTFEAKVTI